MKLLKIFLVVIGAIVAVAVAAVVVFFLSPSLQKSVVLKGLGSMPGLDAKIGHIDLDWNGVSAKDVAILTQDKLGLMIGEVDVRVAFLPLTDKHVNVSRLHVSGLVLDLSRYQPPATTKPEPESSGPFEGVFKPIRDAGLSLSLDDVQVDGQVFLPKQQKAKFTMSGGGIAPGKTGSVKIVSDLSMPPQTAGGVAGVHSEEVISIAQDGKGPTAISVKTQSSAQGPALHGTANVNAAIDLQRTDNGERYHASIVAPGGRELARLEASLAPADSTLTFSYNLNIDPGAFAALGLAAIAPPATVQGEGQGSVNLQSLAGSVAGTLQGTVTPPAAEGSPALPPMGFDARFDAKSDGKSATLAALHVQASLGDNPVLQLVLPQPLTLDLQDPINSLPARTRLVELTLNLPLTALQPFAAPARIDSGSLTGQFAVAVEAGTLKMTPVRPLAIANLGITQPGQAPMGKVNISLRPSFTVSDKRIDFTTAKVTGAIAGSTFLAGELSGGADLVNGQLARLAVDGQFASDLDVVYPLVSPVDPGTQGKLDLAIKARQDDPSAPLQASITAHLKDIAPTGSTQKIDTLTAELNAQRGALGLIQITAPVTIDGPSGKSALSLEGTIETGATGVGFNLTLAGKSIFVPDLQLMAAAYVPQTPESAQEAPATPAPEPDMTPDSAPAWAGIQGSLRTTINRIVATADGQEVTNLAATVHISSEAVDVPDFQASYAGNPATASVRLGFEPGAKPYTLKSAFSVQHMDLSAVDKALRGTQVKPLMEGVFDIQGNASANSPNLPTLAMALNADVDVKGTSAVYHPLADFKYGGTASRISGLAGLAGAVLKDEKAQAYATAGQTIFGALDAVQADQVHLAVQVRNGTDINVRDIFIQGPELKFTGAGKVLYDPKVPTLEQPLALDMQLFAKSGTPIAAALNVPGLLTEPKDEGGYYPGPSFATSGTISNPKSALGEILVAAIKGIGSRKTLNNEDLKFQSNPEQQQNVDQTIQTLKGLLGK